MSNSIIFSNHWIILQSTMEQDNNKELSCSICFEKFIDKKDLKTHTEFKHKENEEYHCGKCEIKFSRKDSMNRHMKWKHGKDGEEYRCGRCENIYNRKDNLNRHMKRKHGDVADDLHSKPMKKKKKYNNLFDIEIDEHIEDMVNEIDLEHFEKQLQDINENDWERLLEVENGNELEEEILKCLHCPKTFTELQNLTRHIREIHTTCEICKLKISRKSKHKCNKKIKVKTRVNFDQLPTTKEDELNSTKSAFNGMLLTKCFKIQKARDPLITLTNYKSKVKRFLEQLLKKNPIKFNLCIHITMIRKDKTGVKDRVTGYFQGSTRTLLRSSEISEMFDRSVQKISKSFDEYLRNGSGFILEKIDYLELYTAEYIPVRGNHYICTPKSIESKKCIVNIKNQDANCFEYSIIASQHYSEIDDQTHCDRPAQYKKWLGKYNFKGCSTPMELDQITKFEKNNDMAINVYHIKHDGKIPSPLRISQKEVKLEKYVNLLLIEGEDFCHYTWIRNFNKLLSFGSNTHKFCFFCCQGFDIRYSQKLLDHMPLCQKYDGQKVILPSKGKNIIQFTDLHKCLEHPVVIYADFETFNQSISGCNPNPSSSFTNKKTKHKCSGYTYTIVSPHFTNSVKTYRPKEGEQDAGEHFVEAMLYEEKRISRILKKIEKTEHKLTASEEKKWEAENKCHICGDLFLNLEKTSLSNDNHLSKLKDLLLKNELPTDKIPSVNLVKKQKRTLSKKLHPDKQVNVSEDEKALKLEKFKMFINDNEELQTYLIENELIENKEEDEEFELEDDLTEEENERIKKKGWKVRDHDHWSGKYRGAAHSGCNLALRKTRKIPVIFHNLSGYDGHIIFQSIPKIEKCKDPHVIARSMENYTAFSIGRLQFMDSLQHLSSSLANLVNNLADKTKIKGCKYCSKRGTEKYISRHEKIDHISDQIEHSHTEKNQTLTELFANTYANFKKKYNHLPDEAFEMLTRKGVYPYNYVDGIEKFQHKLKDLSKSDFTNDLTKQQISEEDYAFVQKLWDTFQLKNLGELHDLYMETDTLLLSDVFQNYRKIILKNYELDPVHFLTAPSLSWAAGLKYTKAQLEIPTDIDTHLFFDLGLRGGISMVVNQFARANNNLMGEKYKSNTQQSFIQYVDANNLYGWAMSQFLPFGGFQWVSRLNSNSSTITDDDDCNKSMQEWEQEIMKLSEEDPVGYMFQVDLEYPEKLHFDLKHDNFPLAPESIKIEKDMLSNYQQKLADEIDVKCGFEKLCLTLRDKDNYVCHYRNLKFYLKHGLKLKKIHRILQFNQSAWLRPYIELNTKLRQKSNNKFEENFFKLMNNSFFGKTCEDVRKYRDVRIARKTEKVSKLVAKPQYKEHRIYDENMVSILLKKTMVTLNKPRYIGMSILDISKLLMYEFHYEYIMEEYPDTKLLFTDTDSFCYYIPTESNFYDDIKGNTKWFDFSNYPITHKNFDNDVNNLKPGKMKDEMGGDIILEFVGLRSKMYSILNLDGGNKKTAKGVINQVKNDLISHDDYKTSLFNKKTFKHTGTKIVQDYHQLYTADLTKVTLNPFNDKKYIMRDGDIFTTYSFGNICI